MLRKKEKVLRQERKKDFKSYFLFSLLFLLLLSVNVFSDQISTAQETNIQQPEIKELDSLEEIVFHQTYKNQTKEERLTKFEFFLFGKNFQAETFESRFTRITSALNKHKEEKNLLIAENLKPTENIPKEKNPQLPVNVHNEGVIGAVNQIELKLFNRTFDDYPFQSRISGLEDKLLSKSEILNNRKKPLLERITILINKANINIGESPVNPRLQEIQLPKQQQEQNTKTYSIDPNSGFLIDEGTGQIVKDLNGNQIQVSKPRQLNDLSFPNNNYGFANQQNQYFPNQQYNNQLQQNQLPYDLFFNQGAQDPGIADPGY